MSTVKFLYVSQHIDGALRMSDKRVRERSRITSSDMAKGTAVIGREEDDGFKDRVRNARRGQFRTEYGGPQLGKKRWRSRLEVLY